jgi:hypothetical protein
VRRRRRRRKKAKDVEPTPKVKENVPNKDIPYPNRMKIDPNKYLYDVFDEALGKLRLELPLAQAILVPNYTKFHWDILIEKIK